MPHVKPAAPIVLHRHALSGHAHRVELFMSLLGLPFTLVDVDLLKGAHKKPEFLAKNLFGQIPVIEDGDVSVSDSNAILVYLALKYADESWYPRDPAAAAAVQRFLSVAAGQIAFGPGAARVSNIFGTPFDPATVTRAAQLLTILDAHLATTNFLAGSQPTIADVACYTYLAHAPEGGIEIAPYANVNAWLSRIKALPGFVPMQATKIGLAA